MDIMPGGLRSRYRGDDLPPPHDPWWHGRVRTLGVETTDENDRPVEHVHHRTGEAIRLNKERSQARRDRAEHDRARLTGQAPIVIDQKVRS